VYSYGVPQEHCCRGFCGAAAAPMAAPHVTASPVDHASLRLLPWLLLPWLLPLWQLLLWLHHPQELLCDWCSRDGSMAATSYAATVPVAAAPPLFAAPMAASPVAAASMEATLVAFPFMAAAP
jgi:hypothetical protein